MVSTTDDILAMLDQVTSKQFRCAVCDRNDDLYHAAVEFYTRTAGAHYDGGIGVDYDTDYDYISAPPALMPIQNWVICGNFKDHQGFTGELPDGVVLDDSTPSTTWVWHPLSSNEIKSTPWPEIQTLRGLDPDA